MLVGNRLVERGVWRVPLLDGFNESIEPLYAVGSFRMTQLRSVQAPPRAG